MFAWGNGVDPGASFYIFLLASYCMLRTKRMNFTDQPCNNRANKVLAPSAFSVLAWTPWNILVSQIDCRVISDHVSEMSLTNVSYDFKAITISSAQFDYWTTINAWWTWDQNTFNKRTGAHQQKQKQKKTVYVSHALNSLFCFIFGHGMIS